MTNSRFFTVGGLAIIAPSSRDPKIQISTLHGDNVTQVDNTSGTPVIDAYAETTEYGLAKYPGAGLGSITADWVTDAAPPTASVV